MQKIIQLRREFARRGPAADNNELKQPALLFVFDGRITSTLEAL
jgi:hypothetical protein